MPFAATWIVLEMIILSEVNQAEKDKYMTLLTCMHAKLLPPCPPFADCSRQAPLPRDSAGRATGAAAMPPPGTVRTQGPASCTFLRWQEGSLPLIESKKKTQMQMNLFTKQKQTHRHRKQSKGAQRGKEARGEGGALAERVQSGAHSTDAPRGLLRGPGSCARYFTMAEKGEGPEKEYMYMCRFGT